MDSKYIVGIEIGSSKIKAAVGIVGRDGSLTVHAVEETKLVDSVRYGVIRNVEIVANTISTILNRLEERFSPRKIESVYVAVGGLGTQTVPVEVDRQLAEEMEITSALIDQLKNEAMAKGVPGREIVGLAPKACYVDRKETTRPEGTYGRHIRLQLNLIACKPQISCNITRAVCDKLGLKINSLVVRQTAEADAVLTPEEKRLGVVLVDFGAETTTVSVYHKGNLCHMATLPLGSRNITRDLTAINYLEERAEEIKTLGGSAVLSDAPSVDSRLAGVNFDEVNKYISARCGEIVTNVKAVIENSHLKPAELPSGIVVIGEGAKLRGFSKRLQDVTKMPVRNGYLNGVIRIADGHVQSGDAVDIISLLWAVAPTAVECMPEPVVVLDPVVEEPEEPAHDADAIVPEPAVEEPHRQIGNEDRPTKRTGNFFTRVAEKLKGAFTEPMDDDDDDDYEDDDDDRR